MDRSTDKTYLFEQMPASQAVRRQILPAGQAALRELGQTSRAKQEISPLLSCKAEELLGTQIANYNDMLLAGCTLLENLLRDFPSGTEEQKAKYLPMLSTGHKVGAFALTEPNAGSDASKGQTEAKLEGDHYVMNCSKIFITNGYVADVFVVFAMNKVLPFFITLLIAGAISAALIVLVTKPQEEA